jgi:hypothetical protein
LNFDLITVAEDTLNTFASCSLPRPGHFQGCTNEAIHFSHNPGTVLDIALALDLTLSISHSRPGICLKRSNIDQMINASSKAAMEGMDATFLVP